MFPSHTPTCPLSLHLSGWSFRPTAFITHPPDLCGRAVDPPLSPFSISHITVSTLFCLPSLGRTTPPDHPCPRRARHSANLLRSHHGRRLFRCRLSSRPGHATVLPSGGFNVTYFFLTFSYFELFGLLVYAALLCSF